MGLSFPTSETSLYDYTEAAPAWDLEAPHAVFTLVVTLIGTRKRSSISLPDTALSHLCGDVE